MFTLEDLTEGSLAHREVHDGIILIVYPTIYGARLAATTRETGIYNVWCYETPEAAFTALATWDAQGEPEGWHRHPATGRRRPGGSQEYVRP